jgi:hypothetical protein
MSSPFQKQFSSKSPMSPLNGAYASGADAMVTVSDAGHFAKLQNDITGATLASMNPKVSKCDSIRNNWHAGDMTDKAYADASKDCGETKGKKLSVNKTKEALEKIGATTTDDKNDPYNLTAKMEKNPGLTDKQSIEQRVGQDLLGRFNVGNIYQ